MEHQRPNLIIISISMLYWFKTSTVDCWKFDARFASDSGGAGGGGGVNGPGGGPVGRPGLIDGALGPGVASGASSAAHARVPKSVNSITADAFTSGGVGGGAAAAASTQHRSTPPAVPISGSSSFAALLNAQQQDMLYACPLNSMCQCAGMPNETSTLIEINCNEVALYKFPGESINI